MSPELDKKLCVKYPKIFKHRNGTIQETCMAWGFAHGDGWFDIIDTLCGIIQHHANIKRKQEPYASLTEEEFDEIHQPVAAQVKEKFGGLRFYCDNTDEYIQGAITLAESMSYRTCEVCGVAGTKRSGGWVRTLCDACEQRGKNLNVTC